MLNGAVAEVAVFAEQFAVVGSDGDVGVFGERSNSSSITVSRYCTAAIWRSRNSRSLSVIERTAFAGAQFAANDMVIEMSEDAMDAADARPVFRWFVRERVGVVGFADVQR